MNIGMGLFHLIWSLLTFVVAFFHGLFGKSLIVFFILLIFAIINLVLMVYYFDGFKGDKK